MGRSTRLNNSVYNGEIFEWYVLNTTRTKETSDTFKIMERKLYRYIMTPAAIFTWISGLSMVHYFGLEFWLIFKIFFVLLLSIFHFYCGICLKKFSIDQNIRSERFFRITNEIPTLLLIIIVVFVVFKP